VMLNQMKTA